MSCPHGNLGWPHKRGSCQCWRRRGWEGGVQPARPHPLPHPPGSLLALPALDLGCRASSPFFKAPAEGDSCTQLRRSPELPSGPRPPEPLAPHLASPEDHRSALMKARQLALSSTFWAPSRPASPTPRGPAQPAGGHHPPPGATCLVRAAESNPGP